MPDIFTSFSGMRAQFNASGSLCRLDAGAISLSLFIGNEVEGSPANLYLRRLGPGGTGKTVEWVALLGPHSPTRFAKSDPNEGLTGQGEWRGIRYAVALRFAQQSQAWFWHVTLENHTAEPQDLDLTYAQDLALAPYGAVRMNEYYVSQYLDHTPLIDPRHGVVIASRQNAAADGRYPWSLIGSLRTGSSYATDALQFYRLSARSGAPPVALLRDLPGSRLQHEHSMVVVRDTPLHLEPRGRSDAGFFGCFLADHPQATSTADLQYVNATVSLPEATAPGRGGSAASAASTVTVGSLFATAPLLNGEELDRTALHELFGSQWRHQELTARGELASFFCGTQRHVVLQAKELEVLRPHGHLLRTGTHQTPDEAALTSTVWMSGVFHSMLTQGHVSINRMLSTTHTYLGLFRSHGQRVFIELDGRWQLLHVPSAFEMSPNACRWIYRHSKGVVEVRSAALGSPHELQLSIEVRSGAATRFLISHHCALNGDDGNTPGATLWKQDPNGISLSPVSGSELGFRFPDGNFRILPQQGTQFAQLGGDELLYPDNTSRQQPFVVIVTTPTTACGVRICGGLIDAAAAPTPLRAATPEGLLPTLTPTGEQQAGLAARVTQLTDIAPWFAHNAWVHFLSPRGLEQYSGGGWGTRDVCQGPVELLLALNQHAPIRDLLLRVMRQQNPDGDWPQWFMFFERERNIRPGDSHGDIVFWPLLALAQYLLASADAAVLDERVPFFDARGASAGENATVWEHVQRALTLIRRRVISGTALAAYGHGDWNDSLQPADPKLREHMCSAWTVTLHFQTLHALAQALQSIDREQDAAPLREWADRVHADFQRLLVVDGVLTGYAIFDDQSGSGTRYLLHPRDLATGVQYSALGMVHAILEDMLTPDQVRAHLKIIDSHLSGPDGVRLFNRPMAYHGGTQRLFQRAETATFFGREIGLMYMHAHLRYAQAMAHIGEADRFFTALCQANPIGVRALVEPATLRQANCYYSSSDAAFADRYHASDEYERVANGTIALDGGWRVYSSGAGIALGLIVRRFVGLNLQAGHVSVDPVLPAGLDGLRLQTRLGEHMLEVCYRVGAAGCGVRHVELNGKVLEFDRSPNPYRLGAARIAMRSFNAALKSESNLLEITLG